MKSYTDISQSKILAAILPLESADMFFSGYTYPEELHLPTFIKTSIKDIPCWSLAALYNILPNTEHISTTLSRGGWKIEPTGYVDKWWCEYEDDNDHTRDVTVTADNPIDACYEMILKLHELNLL